MLPQYSYTEITTYSGNTRIYVFRKRVKRKATSEQKKFLRQQKFLGIALIAISIIGCVIIPEDCGGCLIAGLMGIARVVCD